MVCLGKRALTLSVFMQKTRRIDYRKLPNYDWSWGLTGSVGFELASSTPTARPNSDLDIVIRMPQPLDRETAGVLYGWNTQLPIRIDVQLETPFGAVALAEYARNEKQVLLRTSSGPKLVDTPWSVVTMNQED